MVAGYPSCLLRTGRLGLLSGMGTAAAKALSGSDSGEVETVLICFFANTHMNAADRSRRRNTGLVN